MINNIKSSENDSIIDQLKQIDPSLFDKWNAKNIKPIDCPVGFYFENQFGKIFITNSTKDRSKYNICFLKSGVKDCIRGIFLEDIIRTVETKVFDKKMNTLNEYEKGDLKKISDKSRQNTSNDNPILDKTKSIDNKKENKPIGTNSKVVDAVAITIGSGTKSLLNQPNKLSDFIQHMRSQIPDLDDLIQKNPRFIQGVRKVSNDAARSLSKISKDNLGNK